MSSISIAGNTSGAAVITAPAVAGTPTLTLPTTSGTFALTSNTGLGGIQVYNTAQTNTAFTIPAANLKVTVIGGGGGCSVGTSSSNGGGGGGATAIKYLTGLTVGATLLITVGAGGANTGTTGNTSSVASGTQTITTISATGGSGTTTASGGAGGTTTSGDLNIPGGPGTGGESINVNFGPCFIYNYYISGQGGQSAYGAGNQRSAGSFPGGGGGSGFAGAVGAVIIEW